MGQPNRSKASDVSISTLPPQPLTHTAERLLPGARALIGLGAVTAGAALVVPQPSLTLVLLAAGGGLLALAGLLHALVFLRRRGDATLRARLNDFVGQDAAACLTTDADGEIGYQNRAALQRFGEQRQRPIARALRDCFASPSATLFRLQERARINGVAREDVVTRRGHVRLSVHRLDAGDYMWRLEEIGDRNAMQNGADALGLPMLTAGSSGAVLFMNEAMRRFVGTRLRTLDQLFADEVPRSGHAARIATAEGPMPAIYVDIAGSGGRREVYLLPAPETACGGDPVAPVAAASDFDRVPVPLLRLSATGEVTAINREARALLKAPERDGLRFADLVEDLGRSVDDWLADAMAGRALDRPEVLRAAHAGAEQFVQVTLRRVADGAEPGLVAVLSDATELKSLEAKFVQSQKMHAIGQLAGGVAHDFNNLLTAILGHCDLLLLRHDSDDPDYAELAQIHHNANRAASLVGQLLAFSRKQTLKPQVIDLRDALADLGHLLDRLVGERVKLSLEQNAAPISIRADKRQFEQVIVNLVVNARDAMPQGGEIRIVTEAQTLADDLRRDRAVVPAGEYAVIRVQDGGPGIAPENVGKLFEPFFTTKRAGEGTGLGLSTAYGITKQSGGFIFADSEPGRGATFTLYFPAHSPAFDAAAPPADTRAQDAQAQAAVADAVILLVEDEAPVRAFAARALRIRGFTVLEAEDAEDALALLADETLQVDLFVTDLIMPGMDGPSWVREALRQRPDVRVVFVSGYAEAALTDARDDIPNAVFLPKPFSLEELTTTVRDQLVQTAGAA